MPALQEEEEEVMVQTFVRIDKLQDLGINAADISKLTAAGISTIGSALGTTKKQLLAIKGLSDAKVDKILECCHKLDSRSSFKTGTELAEHRKNVIQLSTGSKSLDELLGGGFETMSISEMFGEFRTGKTQICHTLCVTAQLPVEMGGGNGKVVYIDTEGTFRPERLEPICERYGLDVTAVLDNVMYARALNSDQQCSLIEEVAAHFADDNFVLMIVDSVTALFRVDYSGRGELAERQQKLGRMMSRLTKLAEEFNVAVIVTNQVMSDPSGGAMFVSDPKKPIGGHVLAHASTTRLFLRKGRANERIAKIFDSPSLPEAEATYVIGQAGICDQEG